MFAGVFTKRACLIRFVGSGISVPPQLFMFIIFQFHQIIFLALIIRKMCFKE